MADAAMADVRFQNPMAEGQVDEDLSRYADFEHQLTNDELGDLTFTFQAVDADGSGTIETVELHAMVAILAGPEAEVTMDSVRALFTETKREFRAWLDMQRDSVLLPAAMDLNVLTNQGVHGQTTTGVDRHHAELDIDKTNASNPLWRSVKKFGQHPLIKPLSTRVGRVTDQTTKALQVSKGLLLGSHANESEAEQVKKTLESLMLSDDHMIFAEYVHMMCSTELLQKHFKDRAEDWHKRASNMRKFRHAFGPSDPSPRETSFSVRTG
jgi:hypothetical protein